MHTENKNYLELLERVDRGIDSLIAELESFAYDPIKRHLTIDIRFDTLPLVKKLKNAQSFAKESLAIYRQK